MRWRLSVFCWLVPVMAGPLAGSGLARPLDDAACKQLDQERVALEAQGALTDLRLKPDEIKGLAKERLQRMGRYVDLSGDVLFRCQSVVAPVDLPSSTAAVAAPPVAAVKAIKTAAAPASPKKPAVKKKH